MQKIFIVTGEHSGDIHAGKVVGELKKLNPELVIEGIGGENLKNAGVKLFSDQKKMGAMGLSPKIIIDHVTLGKRLVDYLTKDFQPDLVLLIDYGAFNLNIAKFLKRKSKDIKIAYYIPPQIWASRKWRIKTIKKYVDKVFCIFPFEKQMYEQEGIDVHYCGHPLVHQLPEPANRNEFFERHSLDKNKKLVSIFPGSRTLELNFLMNIFIKAAKILQNLHPDIQFVISHAPNLSDETFNKFLKKTDFKILKGENHSMLSVSDALILASGTVALEAAIYQTPMIISYKGPAFFYFVYLLVRSIDKASLPNIITGKDIVPELLQNDAKADLIAYNIEKLLYNDDDREENIKQLSEVKALLSDKYSAFEVANEINKMLG